MEKIFQLYIFVSYINTIFVLYTNKVAYNGKFEQNKSRISRTKLESGWLNNLEKIVPPFLNGAPIRFNQIQQPCLKLQDC